MQFSKVDQGSSASVGLGQCFHQLETQANPRRSRRKSPPETKFLPPLQQARTRVGREPFFGCGRPGSTAGPVTPCRQCTCCKRSGRTPSRSFPALGARISDKFEAAQSDLTLHYGITATKLKRCMIIDELRARGVTWVAPHPDCVELFGQGERGSRDFRFALKLPDSFTFLRN
jgi:hypothetical protein